MKRSLVDGAHAKYADLPRDACEALSRRLGMPSTEAARLGVRNWRPREHARSLRNQPSEYWSAGTRSRSREGSRWKRCPRCRRVALERVGHHGYLECGLFRGVKALVHVQRRFRGLRRAGRGPIPSPPHRRLPRPSQDHDRDTLTVTARQAILSTSFEVGAHHSSGVEEQVVAIQTAGEERIGQLIREEPPLAREAPAGKARNWSRLIAELRQEASASDNVATSSWPVVSEAIRRSALVMGGVICSGVGGGDRAGSGHGSGRGLWGRDRSRVAVAATGFHDYERKQGTDRMQPTGAR